MPILTPPPTQSKSAVVYKWVILFLYSEDTEFPFSCYQLSSLEKTNFPFHAIEGSMNAELRRQPIELSLTGEPNEKYCIFTKIEDGMYCFIYKKPFFPCRQH